jgi:hypothetical protein
MALDIFSRKQAYGVTEAKRSFLSCGVGAATFAKVDELEGLIPPGSSARCPEMTNPLASTRACARGVTSFPFLPSMQPMHA